VYLNGTRRSIEVNIFNFEKDIYGEDITVHFEALLRLDSRFSTLDELKRQLHDDKVAALRILNGKA
jgi:riboflavin kinase/FMN adenylyltransferase